MTKITADELAEDILSRQGWGSVATEGCTRVLASVTAKQANYLFSLIEREQGHEAIHHEHGRRVAMGCGWTLREARGGSAALEAYKPTDWHPLNQLATTEVK